MATEDGKQNKHAEVHYLLCLEASTNGVVRLKDCNTKDDRLYLDEAAGTTDVFSTEETDANARTFVGFWKDLELSTRPGLMLDGRLNQFQVRVEEGSHILLHHQRV